MNDKTAVMMHRIDVLIKLAGSFVAATGMVAILGWIFDIPSFKSILPGLVTMKTNTAIAFILSGISLYSVIDGRNKSRVRTISQCAALFVLSIGSLTLSEYLFGIDIGIDQLFCREAAGAFGTLSPNRMAPATAVNFTLIGTALFLLNRRKHIIIANILSVVTTILGLITLIGYVYGVREFYGIGKYTQMALHTAVAFFFLGAGAMIAAPEKGIGGVITDGSAGGFFARRLLPTAILLPFVIGYFRVQGERAGLFGCYLGVAIVATIYIVAFGIAVLWSAGLVARSEAMKKLADNSAREAEERYKALYESSRDAIMTLEPYGRFLGGNRAAIQLFGCKDEKEFTAQTPGSLSPERQADGELSADKANEMMRRAMEKGSNFFEWIHLSRDGHEFYATVLLTRMELEGKAILQATVRDITEEKKSERRIRQAAEEWQKTFDAISDLVFIQDATYTILNANRAFCEAMKMPLDEIRGRKCYQLLHGKNHPWPNCPMEKTRLDAKTHTEEVDDPNIGTALLVTTSPVFNERGEVAGSVHIARDISERKKLEDELTRKLDTLEKFQKVTVGRELTMKELKSKIALLETKIREMETKNG